MRGTGLMVGLEVLHPLSEAQRADVRCGLRVPWGDAAGRIVYAMRAGGILLSTDGMEGNVIKMKPPMVFSEGDAVRVIAALDACMAALAADMAAKGVVTGETTGEGTGSLVAAAAAFYAAHPELAVVLDDDESAGGGGGGAASMGWQTDVVVCTGTPWWRYKRTPGATNGRDAADAPPG